ncbi:acyltransferase family protein [Candidatus Desantisbacteria bacterium]|nr:acyltransferase family protein [Candidatus Desantisbacteria bacterium]
MEVVESRIDWIDNAKALGIFLVLLGHQDISPLIRQWIYSFHMPLFFFLSGFLFNFEKYSKDRTFFKRKFHTLLVPYFIFAFISFFFWLFVVRNLSIHGESLKIDPLKPFLGIFYSIGMNGYGNPIENALWFLTCLFVVEAIFWFILKFSKKFSYTLSIFIFFIIVIIGVVYSYTSLVRLPWSMEVACVALIFYAAGFFYKDKIEFGLTLLKHANLPNKLVIITILLSFNILFSIINGRTDMNGSGFHNFILFLASAWMGIAFVLSVSRFSSVNNVFSFFGKNTLIIMGLSGIALFCLRGGIYLISRNLLYFEGIPVFVGIFLSFFLMIILVPVIYFINKYLPFVVGKRTHGC